MHITVSLCPAIVDTSISSNLQQVTTSIDLLPNANDTGILPFTVPKVGCIEFTRRSIAIKFSTLMDTILSAQVKAEQCYHRSLQLCGRKYRTAEELMNWDTNTPLSRACTSFDRGILSHVQHDVAAREPHWWIYLCNARNSSCLQHQRRCVRIVTIRIFVDESREVVFHKVQQLAPNIARSDCQIFKMKRICTSRWKLGKIRMKIFPFPT